MTKELKLEKSKELYKHKPRFHKLVQTMIYLAEEEILSKGELDMALLLSKSMINKKIQKSKEPVECTYTGEFIHVL